MAVVSKPVSRPVSKLLSPPEPQFSYDFPMDYLERVKTVHEKGGYGSTGYVCV